MLPRPPRSTLFPYSTLSDLLEFRDLAVSDHPEVHLVRGHIGWRSDRKSTRLNSSHRTISYAVFCLKKKKSIQSTSTYTPSPYPSLQQCCPPYSPTHRVLSST